MNSPRQRSRTISTDTPRTDYRKAPRRRNVEVSQERFFDELQTIIDEQHKGRRATFCERVGLHFTYLNVLRKTGSLPGRNAARLIDIYLGGRGYWMLLCGYLPDKWDPKIVWEMMNENYQL